MRNNQGSQSISRHKEDMIGFVTNIRNIDKYLEEQIYGSKKSLMPQNFKNDINWIIDAYELAKVTFRWFSKRCYSECGWC